MKIKGFLSYALVLSASMFLLSGCFSLNLANNESKKTTYNGKEYVKSQTSEANAQLADAR